jgi:membrane protease YdiL (CAAX protease family)
MFKTSIILYFLLACLISWSAKFYLASIEIGQVSGNIPKGLLQLVAQFGPSLAGLILIFSEKGKRGLINLFKNITGLNVHYKWFIFALLFELLLFHLVLFFCVISGYGDVKIQTDLLPISYWNFLVNATIFSLLTGLGEEIGWRGYLLPKLQSKYIIIVSAIVLSFFNSIWHLRNDCIVMLLQNDLTGFSQVYFPDMGLRLLITIPVICVLIFVFNATKGSLLVMILYHGTANASYEWVKEITGNSNPEFLLPVFAVSLWIAAIYFAPAIILQAKNKKLITQIY